MKQRLQEALKGCRADYADIRFETMDTTSFTFRGKEQEGASSSMMQGGVVRACINGGWGMVAFDSLDSIAEHLAEACEYARLVSSCRSEKTMIADGPVCTSDFKAEMKDDFRNHTLEEKVRTMEEYNKMIMGAAPEIESSVVRYNDRFRTVYYASTRGACFMEERPFIGLLLSAVARKGDLIQRGFKSLGSIDDYGMVLGREDDAQAAVKRAVELLAAPKVTGGRKTVILDPAFTGLFTHEAFGHLSEADFLFENPPVRDLMHIGRKVGPEFLNIVDDGSLPGLMGSERVDDEGTPTQRNMLVKNGVLVGHLHSLETAAKMGEQPTGNARAINGGFNPIVRMTNTFIEPGAWKKEDLFKDVDDGIYACEGIGGQTQMEMFTFTASYGYVIKNGQIQDLVRDVMVTGNVFETLDNIDAIADDLVLFKNSGGCGKGGQSPLPVSDGGPHIRVRNAVSA